MIEDRLLIWKFKCGSKDALRRIYEKYAGFLLTLATALLNDVNIAEDVVHDFFVSFAQSSEKLQLNGNFKWYLATCVMNRARDRIRARQLQIVGLDKADSVYSDAHEPESVAVCNEELQQLSVAMEQLPYEQREVVLLHTKGEMKFRQIAKLQNVSIKTVQSRYRYGLDKLRSLLNCCEMEK
jgi:RNA polymerase sigma-70 factor (ECF subfamily)